MSVECLKNSNLKGKAIAVGGHSDRGVIASCSYEARKFGIKSAMPMRLAKRLCPHLLIVRGEMDSYSKYSRLVGNRTTIFIKGGLLSSFCCKSYPRFLGS